VPERHAAIRRELGLRRDADLPLAMARLRSRIGLPERLGALGLAEADLERAADGAASDYSSRTNPRLADSGHYLAMLRAAF
jgi:alcohol dehydrogenase class IV